ncbi:hypothetical protein JCM17380_03590 [Desulfosporosinus burensis]
MPFNMERLQIKGDGEIIYVNKYDYQGIVLNRRLDILVFVQLMEKLSSTL